LDLDLNISSLFGDIVFMVRPTALQSWVAGYVYGVTQDTPVPKSMSDFFCAGAATAWHDEMLREYMDPEDAVEFYN